MQSMRPLRNKERSISLIALVVLLAFLIAVPPVVKGVFENTQGFLRDESASDRFLFAVAVIIVIAIGTLIWYVIYIKATAKIKLQRSIYENMGTVLESREQFRKIFEDSPVPYFILDPKGVIQDLNKAALRFFKCLPEDVVGTNFFSHISPEDADDMNQLVKYYELKSSIDKREIRMVTKKRETRWVLMSFFEIKENDKGGYHGFVSIWDITEQRSLDQVKTEFISLASHQMRTPLATTKWYTEMLLSPNFGQLNQKQEEYVRTLHEVNENMIDLVDTLLNVSRLELGKLTVDIQPTNVQEVTESIFTELSAQVEKKRMNIVRNYGGLLENVDTDPKLLRIIIHNLLTNSLKYTPEGGTITVTFGDEGGKRMVTVSDTGCGIPAKEQDKVFTKLFRAENVKDIMSSQSTGLGLYLIKSLAEALGGSITFRSVENEGSSFTITLK